MEGAQGPRLERGGEAMVANRDPISNSFEFGVHMLQQTVLNIVYFLNTAPSQPLS
jgi:hypothetical protein